MERNGGRRPCVRPLPARLHTATVEGRGTTSAAAVNLGQDLSGNYKMKGDEINKVGLVKIKKIRQTNKRPTFCSRLGRPRLPRWTPPMRQAAAATVAAIHAPTINWKSTKRRKMK